MRLTQWTDYSLRVLMYCAACQQRAQPVTISEIADSHAISRSHLTKIVHQLGAQGLLETTRGRGGGMRLCLPAAEADGAAGAAGVSGGARGKPHASRLDCGAWTTPQSNTFTWAPWRSPPLALPCAAWPR